MFGLSSLIRDALLALASVIPPRQPVFTIPVAEPDKTHVTQTVLIAKLIAYLEGLRTHVRYIVMAQAVSSSMPADPDHLCTQPFEHTYITATAEYTDDLSQIRLVVRCRDDAFQDLVFQALVAVFGINDVDDSYVLHETGFEFSIACISAEEYDEYRWATGKELFD